MHRESLDGDHIFVIHDFMSKQEAAALIAASEAAGYTDATITTGGGFVMNKDVRDNGRLFVDDTAMAGDLWLRMRELVPFFIHSARAVGLNERFRYYRYGPGQKFAPHYDGYYSRGN